MGTSDRFFFSRDQEEGGTGQQVVGGEAKVLCLDVG